MENPFESLERRLISIEQKLDSKFEIKHSNNPLSETWLDIVETCALLKISKRTLQSYRDNGILSFSQISGKIYFKASDIDELLKKHYVKAFRRH